MSSSPTLAEDLRAAILAKADAILDDKDLMNALVAANERAMGNNIIDLRGIAMERLETRLDRLEDTHRNVIAAAYENLAGTNQVQRAVLRLLEATDFETFLADLRGEVSEILRVDAVTLVLETASTESAPAVDRLGGALKLAEPGFIDAHLTRGRSSSPRQVTLRQIQGGAARLYGDRAGWIRSEALLRLDLGPRRLPGLLALGAEDPHQFTPQHGTDLLGFFGGVFERSMRHWLK